MYKDRGEFVNVYEVYQMFRGPVMIDKIGKWWKSSGRYEGLPLSSVWDRRRSLGGAALDAKHMSFLPLYALTPGKAGIKHLVLPEQGQGV